MGVFSKNSSLVRQPILHSRTVSSRPNGRPTDTILPKNKLLFMLLAIPVLIFSLACQRKLILQIKRSNLLPSNLLPSHPSPNTELQLLVSYHTKYECPEGLVFMEDHIRTDNATHPTGCKIPNLLHRTAKSRCMTQPFASNVEKWKNTLGEKYSIYIHDDGAVNKFIYEKRWMEFPELKEVMACVTAGVSAIKYHV